MLETLSGFINNVNSRQKILDLLCMNIIREFQYLTTQEKCYFVRSLSYIEDEAATEQVSGQIDFTTSIDCYLEQVEPYIAD